MNPLFLTDFYKVSHYKMYPAGTTKIYSNLTPRKSRIPGIDKVVVFGLQYFILEYLLKQWTDNFFNRSKEDVLNEYMETIDSTLGINSITLTHIAQLWDLQYLPLKIKALQEGSLCPIGVPCLTITNTVDHAYWLVNYMETILSCTLWQMITSATIAREYRLLLTKYAMDTIGNSDFVQWQGHDFSMRGMSSLETACMSGGAHLLSFTGTDTIPAIKWLEKYYNADVKKELIGASVPATEHSVMCMGTKEEEILTFERLLDQYPKGILSVVSDTWDLWKVCTKYMSILKEKILSREGKLVIRPDSGDPVDIICGLNSKPGYIPFGNGPEVKGVIELLWDVFGGTVSDKGYKVLDPHIGAIYGDSITLERAEDICERLKAKGFASTNIVFGIGSYTYQYNTRDTFGFAVKATYGEVMEDKEGGYSELVCREIYKNPITDDGTKKSAKGLLNVSHNDFDGAYQLMDCCSKEEEACGELKTVFEDGHLIKSFSLAEIRERIKLF